MAAFKSSLDFFEPQVNKCSTSLSPTVAVRAGICFLAILFVPLLKATFRYPLTTEAILSVFLGKMDSAAENQRKTGVAKASMFTSFNAAVRTLRTCMECAQCVHAACTMRACNVHSWCVRATWDVHGANGAYHQEPRCDTLLS